MKHDLNKEIKKEFPEKEKGLSGNERELLHKGLNEGNNPWVKNFLYVKSQFSVTELAIIDEKDEKELEEATKAKARALALYDRWITLYK